jgi:hypothetical protein
MDKCDVLGYCFCWFSGSGWEYGFFIEWVAAWIGVPMEEASRRLRTDPAFRSSWLAAWEGE